MNTNIRSTNAAWFAAWATAVALAALAVPVQSAPAAQRDFSAQKPADPSGTVEIVNVEGNVEVTGWNQPTVDVTGKLGSRVERVDVTSSANRTTIRVVIPNGGGNWHGENAADLKVHVPQNSSLEVSLVSADLSTNGVGGNQHLQTVSGHIKGDVGGGSLQVDTVSGDVLLTAHNGRNAQIKTVSGDVGLSGTSGDLTLNTVSGDSIVTIGDVTRATIESVSGDLNLTTGALGAQSQLDASTVSGDVKLQFAAAPDADIDVQSFSGDISNCFGPKPVEEKYGPGSRLNFRNGKGGAHVHVESKSGDVGICAGK
jgi:Putative adhesin